MTDLPVADEDLGGVGPDQVDDDAGNRVVGAVPRAVVDYIARQIVDDPDAVVVEADSSAPLRPGWTLVPARGGLLVGPDHVPRLEDQTP